jgi:hypothetical protein
VFCFLCVLVCLGQAINKINHWHFMSVCICW